MLLTSSFWLVGFVSAISENTQRPPPCRACCTCQYRSLWFPRHYASTYIFPHLYSLWDESPGGVFLAPQWHQSHWCNPRPIKNSCMYSFEIDKGCCHVFLQLSTKAKTLWHAVRLVLESKGPKCLMIRMGHILWPRCHHLRHFFQENILPLSTNNSGTVYEWMLWEEMMNSKGENLQEE